jgi:hypothetical protein
LDCRAQSGYKLTSIDRRAGDDDGLKAARDPGASGFDARIPW